MRRAGEGWVGGMKEEGVGVRREGERGDEQENEDREGVIRTGAGWGGG